MTSFGGGSDWPGGWFLGGPGRRAAPSRPGTPCRRAGLASGLALPSSARPSGGPPSSAAGDMPRVWTWLRGTSPVVAPTTEDMSSGRLPQPWTCPVLRSTNGHEGSMSTRAGQPRACPAVTSVSGGHAPLSHGARGRDVQPSTRCGGRGRYRPASGALSHPLPRVEGHRTCSLADPGAAHRFILRADLGGHAHSGCGLLWACSFFAPGWIGHVQSLIRTIGMLIGLSWLGGTCSFPAPNPGPCSFFAPGWMGHVHSWIRTVDIVGLCPFLADGGEHVPWQQRSGSQMCGPAPAAPAPRPPHPGPRTPGPRPPAPRSSAARASGDSGPRQLFRRRQTWTQRDLMQS